MERCGAILGAVVQQSTAIDQSNEQLVGLLGTGGHRERRLAAFRAVKIWIQALGTHLGYLLHMAPIDAVQEATQVGTRVQRLQLALVQCEHFIHATLVLELQRTAERIREVGVSQVHCIHVCLIDGTNLKVTDGSIEWIVAQAPLLVQKLARFPIRGWCKEAIVEALLQLLQQEEERIEDELYSVTLTALSAGFCLVHQVCHSRAQVVHFSHAQPLTHMHCHPHMHRKDFLLALGEAPDAGGFTMLPLMSA